MNPQDLDFDKDGAMFYRAVFSSAEIERLRNEVEPAIAGRPGKRLRDGTWVKKVANGKLLQITRRLIGSAVRPVRAVIFDKTPDTNWSVGWHQDRTISVRDRVEVEGFGPWSVKDGLLHVEPPVAILEGMVTVRLHLDDCAADNAPLKVALGSHRLGRVAADKVADIASDLPLYHCQAQAGDVWAYSTLILHASERALSPKRRRVLQIDYAATDLPGGLKWRGLD
ncbi:phytanoyl-CoA dioxygenase family protein [Asticcacaulis machinosus]|uniref:Phytanoyl-CoA dioxygenase family protein n=1 Tax=Asticcacaulis machinosus TaxID=2984211 RepID=A0ABT5HM54_9CAUL|nr:phytanoyl-CoA dioxygenase family protein [Asticcacaulis machinosus]MDC7677312.1 phytanoyl-CoA dioxygenase family protein [Asticcacaulis machinosus]